MSSFFLYQLSLPPQLNEFFHLAAVVPRELTASLAGIPVNQPVPEWMTLITSQFLHGGFCTYGNMLFLWILATTLKTVGHVNI